MKAWLCMLLLVCGAPLGAQSSREDRVAVLKFGIESEVLELVRNLRQEKNIEYREVLIATFASARTDELKEAILLLFTETKDDGLQDPATQVLANPEKKSNSLLLNCLSYLTELKYGGVKDTLVTLTQDKNKVLALGAIRALGKLGAQDKAGELIRIYKDAETDPNFKPDLIWALGEMKASEAVELFLKEYDDNESQPLLRRSLLEALGKIGDGQAWDRVEAALADSNTDLRAAAVAILPSFPGRGDKVSLLTSALRDSQVAVRQAATQAAQVAKLSELKELLMYRAKKDPDAKVRTNALQALAAYDDGPTTVLSFLGDNKASDVTVWREALNLALTKQYPGTLETLKSVLEAELKNKSGTLTPFVAGALLPYRDQYRTLFGLILTSDKAPARASALRAIAVGKFTEYETVLKTLSAKDPDPGIKSQATSILKDWGVVPTPTPVPRSVR